jgi:hypothetical protein
MSRGGQSYLKSNADVALVDDFCPKSNSDKLNNDLLKNNANEAKGDKKTVAM